MLAARPAQDAQPGVDVVVVDVAPAKVAGSTTLEAVAAVQDTPVVEADEIAGSERVADLESVVTGDLGEDA